MHHTRTPVIMPPKFRVLSITEAREAGDDGFAATLTLTGLGVAEQRVTLFVKRTPGLNLAGATAAAARQFERWCASVTPN